MYIWSQNLISPTCLHDEHKENVIFLLNCKFTRGNIHVSHCTPLCVKSKGYECVRTKTRQKVYNKKAQHVNINFTVINFQYRRDAREMGQTNTRKAHKNIWLYRQKKQ